MENGIISDFDDPHYIYLIKTEEYIINKLPIYKFGKTKRPDKRFKEYGRKVSIILLIAVYDCTRVEDKIIKLFKSKYIKIKGNEYFQGDINTMIFDVISVCNLYGDLGAIFDDIDSVSDNSTEHENLTSDIETYIFDSVNIANKSNEKLHNDFLTYVNKTLTGNISSYLKAAESIAKCTSEIRNYEDAKNLPSIGDKIATILDTNFIDLDVKISAITEKDMITYTKLLTPKILSNDPKFREYLAICNNYRSKIKRLYKKYCSTALALYKYNDFALYLYDLSNNIPKTNFLIDPTLGINRDGFTEKMMETNIYTFNGLDVYDTSNSKLAKYNLPSYNETYNLVIWNNKITIDFLQALDNLEKLQNTILSD